MIVINVPSRNFAAADGAPVALHGSYRFDAAAIETHTGQISDAVYRLHAGFAAAFQEIRCGIIQVELRDILPY